MKEVRDMWKSGKLTGDRVYLRAYRTSDAQALSDMTARDEIYRTTYNIQREFDVDHARWWIKFNANCRRTGTSYEFGIFEKDTDRLIGNIGIVNVNNRCRHATLAYYIHPEMWNKGIATEAGRVILDYAFSRLDFLSVLNNADIKNPDIRNKPGIKSERIYSIVNILIVRFGIS